MIFADRHSDTTFTDCLVIECTNENSSLDISKHILNLEDRSETLDNILPWLKENLTEKQLQLLSVLSDPLSRKILAYLASGESNETP